MLVKVLQDCRSASQPTVIGLKTVKTNCHINKTEKTKKEKYVVEAWPMNFELLVVHLAVEQRMVPLASDIVHPGI